MTIEVDGVLAEELRNPGSDRRFGVNFIARPPCSLVKSIRRLQRRLKLWEPDQYHYPARDLHLTFFEICAEKDPVTVADLGARVIRALAPITFPATLAGLGTVKVGSPCFRWSTGTCTLSFRTIEGLVPARLALRRRLRDAGIEVDPRHDLNSEFAHITFMRYRKAPADRWEKHLKELAGSSVGNVPAWRIKELWLTCGANWYGMRKRIVEIGPFRLV